MNQKKFIGVNFSEGLGIFDDHYGYPVIDHEEKHNGPTGKVVDIQGPQAHAGRNFFVPEGKEFSFDIDESPHLHIAVKAEEGTNTCLFLCVRDKAPREHVRRFVVIGRTLEGDAGIYDTIKDCFDIKDDGQWHEYDFDLRKIREKQDDEYPYYPDAGSISIIQFYSWTGTGEQTFYFNDLSSNTVGPKIEKHRVEGHIFLEYGLPAGDIPVRLYSRGLSGEETPLGKGRTNDEGFYRVSYDPGVKPVNLEARIVDAHRNEIPLSAPKFTAEKHEVLNLVAPAHIKPLPAEYQRLTSDIEKQRVVELADIRENSERQDLTILHQATGWDARLIALASTASRVSADTGLQQDALYALFRTGLPTDKQKLASVSSSAVEKALNKAKDAGIIGTDFSVENAKKSFETFSRDTLRKVRAPGTLSSFREMLDKSGVSGNDKSKFEDVYFAHRGTPAELWQEAKNRGIKEESIKSLRLQGKLAYLTLNNAKLTETLQKEIGSLDNLAQLSGNGVDRKKDYYNEDTWKNLLKEDLANNNEQELQKLIPLAYVGEKADDRLDAYAADLARKVRLSFPTRVVGRMIENGELFLGTGHDKTTVETAVATFLKDAEKFGFELGRVPVGAFVQKNKKKLFRRNITEQKIKATENSVKKLQRLYQITPSNEALKAILKLGFNSAQDVVAFSRDEFIDSFGPSFPSRSEAEFVYRKSQQVSAVTQSFFTTAMLMDSAPTIHAMSPSAEVRENSRNELIKHYPTMKSLFGSQDSPSAEVRENARNELIKHYPTMESLFGSMDFCECEQCRSVLSPAAYFVDLLKFLDPDDQVWKETLKTWKKNHNDERYKKDWNYDHTGETYEDERKKAYYELIEHRPDLPHLPLTCENTNTVLPYIDVVNEILEYYVANSNLNKYQGHDTGDATTPELLAEPQNILPEAYSELKKARYPLALPFDLWLETVRHFFDHFEMPLWQVMEVFRPTNELFDPAIGNPTNIINATVNVPDVNAVKFRAGDVMTYYDVSADALHTETKTISSIGAAGSGGAGRTLVTLSGIWKNPPAANDLLVKAYLNYNRAAIFSEYLGFSPTEYGIFTDPDRLAKWWELYGYDDQSTALNGVKEGEDNYIIPPLKSARTLARRLGVSYNELTEIVQTSFVNPELAKLAIIWKLGFNVTDVVRYFNNRNKPEYSAEKEDIEKRLNNFDTEHKLKANYSLSELTKLWTDGTFKKTLVLRDPSTLCNFDKTYLEFAVSEPLFGWDKVTDTEKEPGKDRYKLIYHLIEKFGLNWLDPVFVINRKIDKGNTLKVKGRFVWPPSKQNYILIKLNETKTEANLTISTDKRTGEVFPELENGKINIYLAEEKAIKDRNLELVLIKINLFVRLWKKLGWTIEETDRALQVFMPNNIQPVTDRYFEVAFGTAFKTALVYLAHLKSLDERVNVGKDSRLKLLTLWSNLPTTGKNPLYAQLFLTHSVLKSDPVFDDPLGYYLSKAGVLIKDHLLAIQAALNLTADEIKQIIEDAQRKLDNEPLTLEIVSLLCRYGLLAKVLKLSVIDLITLKKLSDRNPFESLKSGPLATINDDYPYMRTLHFVEVLEKVKESGFTIEDLDFLLCHHFDPVGKYRSKSDTILALALMKTLATEILRIQSEHTIISEDLLRQKLTSKLPLSAEPENFIKMVRELAGNAPITDADLRNKIKALLTTPCTNDLFEVVKSLITDLHSEYATVTDDVLRQKLSLVLPADILDMFFGFWKDTVEFSAKKEQVKGNKRLDPVTYQVNSIRVSYDATREWQYVVHVGILTDEKRDEILKKIPVPGATAPDKLDAYNYFKDELLKDIKEKSEADPKAFIGKHFEGFLTYDDLYGPDTIGLLKEAKRHRILAEILPFVQQRLIRQLIVQNVAADLNAEPALAEMLLVDSRLLTDPSQSGKLLLDAFAASGERGVSAKFFGSSGTQLGQTITTETADTAIKVDNTPVKPAGAKSARFEGYIEVPATGAYRFFVVFTTQNSTAELRFAHLPDPVIRYKDTKNKDETDQFVELKAGIPYRFTFEIGDLMDGDVSLLVQGEQGENLPKDSLSRLTLYPQAVVERFTRTHVLLAKTLQLIQGLDLSEREVRHILTHHADFENIDLSRLPTIENDSSAESPEILFKQFLVLADYAHLKRDLSAGTDDLIGIFENAHCTYPEITDAEEAKTSHFEPIAHLTRRDSATVRAVSESLGFAINAVQDGNGYRVGVPEIANVEKFWRLWEALQIVEKLGVPVGKIVGWATPAPDFSIARDLRNTVNARYEQENWQRIAQSIFDNLRQRKRDVLVAYIMHKEGFERIEQLFEYFLIDPGMEPVVQTSRVKLAISSVQLFIQRSLLNLEKHVHPTAINSQHWQWMKRYRVWEANRKIFLFPENWLEPEFRDGKTHLFQELESALLQGDVSNDLVENAFFNYLKKLEELARLDIVTMYCEEKTDSDLNILHVIGRTFNLPHKYFYRRYAHQMWTPWEPVTAEIEGDHVVAVVWKERLHLFWLTFLEKAKQETMKDDKGKELTITKMAGKKVSEIVSSKTVEVQLNWSEYFQGEWMTRESSGFANPISKDVSNNFKSSEVFIFVSQSEDGALLVNLDHPINMAFRMVSKNSPPEPVGRVAPQSPLYSITDKQPTRYTGSGALTVTFVERLETEYIIQGIREDSKFSLLFCPGPPTSMDISTIRDIIRGIISKIDELKRPLPDWFTNYIPGYSDFNDGLDYFVDEYLSVGSRPTNAWKSIKDGFQEVKVAAAKEENAHFMPMMNSIEELINIIDVLLRQHIDFAGATAVADPVSAEIRKLVNPFFYQDEQHTFFVEPTPTETTVTDWEEWVISSIPRHKAMWETLVVEERSAIPVEKYVPVIKSSLPYPIDPVAHLRIESKIDWVTDPATVLRFDDHFIGQEGGIDLKVLPAGTNVSDFGTLVNVNPGSELVSDSVVVAYGERKLGAGRFQLPEGGLNVVGGGGMNSALLRSLSKKYRGV